MRDGREFTRGQRAKLNIIMSLTSQIVTLACGLVLPRLIIGNYGSSAYGATTSIAQFLGYISLLDGGISGVARATLYKPLAENDTQRISDIIVQIKKFFQIVAFVFVGYVFILAYFYKDIAHTSEFERKFTFFLVLAISVATFAQYFIGISYSILIQASQKNYIINTVSVVTVILNTFLTVVLVKSGCNLIVVKLVSSFVFVARPLVFWFYVHKKYSLLPSSGGSNDALKQKWTGLGQHIAFFYITILTRLF